VCVCLSVSLCVYVDTYIHTYIRIYIHTYIHTYIYTHIHTRRQPSAIQRLQDQLSELRAQVHILTKHYTKHTKLNINYPSFAHRYTFSKILSQVQYIVNLLSEVHYIETLLFRICVFMIIFFIFLFVHTARR